MPIDVVQMRSSGHDDDRLTISHIKMQQTYIFLFKWQFDNSLTLSHNFINTEYINLESSYVDHQNVVT